MLSILFTLPVAIVFIALLVYIIIFWIRYSLISTYFQKWSKGEFVAPEKRFNKLMLHGLGADLLVMALISGYVLIFKLCGVTDVTDPEFSAALIAVEIGSIVLLFGGFYLYWYIVYKIKMKNGATKRGVAFEVLYGCFTFAAWASIVVLAIYAIMFAVLLVVGYLLLRLILFFCLSEQITVKKPGIFGGTKKVWAERNLDGTYTDAEGNKYK